MNIRQDAAMNERVMTIEEMQRNTAQSGYYRSKQAGISLVEVLVVIVILAIGIFSVVRLFPPGLGIVQEVAAIR
ncbi:MAG: prepilin-type N-terminal cleavage/methylation domain-containing protein, partial [Chthonomonadales bacterium]